MQINLFEMLRNRTGFFFKSCLILFSQYFSVLLEMGNFYVHAFVFYVMLGNNGLHRGQQT